MEKAIEKRIKPLLVVSSAGADEFTGKGPIAVFKMGWKEALQWVLDGFEELYDGDMENSHIAQRIKRELGE